MYKFENLTRKKKVVNVDSSKLVIGNDKHYSKDFWDTILK